MNGKATKMKQENLPTLLRNLRLTLRVAIDLTVSFFKIPRVSHGVWICGGSRITDDSAEFKKIRWFSYLIVVLSFRKAKIVQGGGPGAMKAAALGATEALGSAFSFVLPFAGEEPHGFFHGIHSHTYFFTRKLRMARESKAVVFFRGGVGTLDELFEMFVLVQNKKSPPVPLYLVEKPYWNSLVQWLNAVVVPHKMMSAESMALITQVDDTEEELFALAQTIAEQLLPSGYTPSAEELALQARQLAELPHLAEYIGE